MIKAILFDLDGTLLPMDQDIFLKAYFGGLVKAMVPHGYDPDLVVKSIWAGTGAMVKNDGIRTNEEVFWEDFCHIFGPDARKDEPLFQEFYAADFGQARTVCGFRPEAAGIIALLKERGIDSRRVIVDESAPLYHIGVDEKYPPMLIIVSDNDMKNRYEQTMLVMSTLKHFGLDENVKLRVMHSTHCGYVGKVDENGVSIFGKLISDFILGE